MLSVQLAGNEGFEPFSLLLPQELSVETIMRVIMSVTVSMLPTMQETGAGVVGHLDYVFTSISNITGTTERSANETRIFRTIQ